MKVLGIFGTGRLGREVLDLAKGINDFSREWEQIVFIVDDGYKTVESVNGASVFVLSEFFSSFTADEAAIVIAIGEPKLRAVKREFVTSRGYRLRTLIHPTAFVSEFAEVGNGCIIRSFAILSCNIRLGENILIQPKAEIGHDIVVGADSVISSQVEIGGSSIIGDRVYIGMNAAVKEKIHIGDDSIISMSAAVFVDIPDKVIAVGNPARVMKNNEEGKVFK